MTKFSALSIDDLRTAAAAEGRKARGAKFVVDVEVNDGSWCELDADSEDHARALARNWVDVLESRGASCWHADSDGNVRRRPFFTYYA